MGAHSANPSAIAASRLYHIYRLAWSALDWLFPPLCGGCAKPGTRWCAECQGRALTLPLPACDRCGLPLGSESRCRNCRGAPQPYRAMRSWTVFASPIREALHRLKYRRDLGLGDALAAHMAGYVSALDWKIDLLTPVPLGKKRRNERGYNQVALVALPLALRMGWVYAPDALARVRETASQVGLTAAERRENVRDAFGASGSRVVGRTVLLMDDVATTGSTLASAAGALLAAGAREVYALTIARALPQYGWDNA